MAYIPGGQAVLGDLTVRENIELAARHAGGPGREATVDDPLTAALAHFPELRERLDTRARDLSGGEQQMVALAQGFALEPELLLIDEMSLGLAPAAVDRLIEAVRACNATGTTVLLVEQSLNLALRIADRIVYMDQGSVLFSGDAAEFRDRPELVRSQFTARASAARTRARSRAARRPSGDQAVPALLADGITVEYGGLRALDEVGLEVPAGHVVGLIGSNGAGKTSLFDVLSGYQPPQRGRVELEGRDVTDLSPDARARLGLARAFQSARLFGPLSVRETIAVALEKRADASVLGAALWLPATRGREQRLLARVDALIELFGLTRHADAPIATLSTGTRRAVEVACQMAIEPKVLLLDEPSSGLAQAEVEGLGPAIRRIVRDTGCGVVLIDHDLPLITSVSDSLVALDRGRVVTSGPVDDVLAHDAVRAGYLDASDATLHRSGADDTSGHQPGTTPKEPQEGDRP